MPGGVYLTMSAMKLKLNELDNLAHNLANANTNGFKEEKINFHSVLSNAQSGDGEAESTAVAEKSINFAQGSIVQTSGDFDLALEGKGFFEVQTENGTLYTRNGAFGLNQSGELVDSRGGKVMGENGVIIPGIGSRVDVSTTGVITVDGAEKGKVKIVEFEDLSKLKAVGASSFEAEQGVSSKLAANTQVLQGKVEASNTSVVGNLVKLVEVSRQYEAYQKILGQQSKMETESATSLGRLT